MTFPVILIEGHNPGESASKMFNSFQDRAGVLIIILKKK